MLFVSINLRVNPTLLGLVDKYTLEQESPSRTESIRRLLIAGLAAVGTIPTKEGVSLNPQSKNAVPVIVDGKFAGWGIEL